MPKEKIEKRVREALGGSHRANRTGLARSEHREAMLENAAPGAFEMRGTPEDFVRHRAADLRGAPPIGSMPPPTGLAEAAKEALQGEARAMLLDKLGERLAFERVGVRLYQALREKLQAKGGFEGGPSPEDLERIAREELEHFRLLAKALESMGGDPTAVTPSADLVGVEGSGLLKVVTDPRTDLEESLHAMLVAELADGEGWTLLCDVAERTGQDELARDCRRALGEEERHLEWVRGWVQERAFAAIG